MNDLLIKERIVEDRISGNKKLPDGRTIAPAPLDVNMASEIFYNKPAYRIIPQIGIKNFRKRCIKFARKGRETVTPQTSTRFGLAALPTPIPSQYAKLGVAYSYQVPAGTGTDLVYTAFTNRLIEGRNLPLWLNFNPATRTFSGTPNFWWEVDMLQIFVEAHESATPATKVYQYFPLRVGSSENTGRPCWKAGSTPDHILTLANIGGFNVATVTATQWVLVNDDVTRGTVTQSMRDKFTAIRTAGGYLVWKVNNNNGFKSSPTSSTEGQNWIDYDLVLGGETIAIEGTGGSFKALNPFGKLWRGVRGNEIYVTNYSSPVTIVGDGVNPISQTRSEVTQTYRDDNWVVFGQPVKDANGAYQPYINLYGLTVTGVIGWSHAGGGGNNTEAAFVKINSYGIGMHWKPNTTPDKGDRRASLNKYGWDMNMTRQYIHDCHIHSRDGEGIYLGGGSYKGQTVKVMHYNTDGSNKMVLYNGVNVHEYHNVRRFNSFHDHVRIENNIFIENGWDSCQTRNVIADQLIRFNYIFKTAQSPAVTGGQSEALIFGGTVGEISYNFMEKGWQTGLRANMLGRDSVHHNIVVWIGHDADFTSPNLIPNGGGIAIYAGNDGTIIDDRPQLWIADHPSWSDITTYVFDSYQSKPSDRGEKVKHLGISYRSLQPNNLGHDPSTSPLWWEDTKEWISYKANNTFVLADLYFYCFHNTFVECTKNTVQNFLTIPKNQTYWYNNLWVNCATTVLNFGTGANNGGNMALIGVNLALYFESDVNRDYRLLTGASAKNAGVDISALVTARPEAFTVPLGGTRNLDFCGVAHAATPSIGAIEFGSVKNDHYVWKVNTGAPVTPSPITLDLGPNQSFNMPQNSTSVTAVKSDPARVLNSIQWSQVSGPVATITNGTTLTATFSNLQLGISVFQITVVDSYGQSTTKSINITVNPEGIINTVTYQWYTATAINPVAGKTAILNSDVLSLDLTPYITSGLYVTRAIRLVAKKGTLIAPETESNYLGPL